MESPGLPTRKMSLAHPPGEGRIKTPGAGGGPPGSIDKNDLLALPPAKGQIPKPRERGGWGAPPPPTPRLLQLCYKPSTSIDFKNKG